MHAAYSVDHVKLDYSHHGRGADLGFVHEPVIVGVLCQTVTGHNIGRCGNLQRPNLTTEHGIQNRRLEADLPVVEWSTAWNVDRQHLIRHRAKGQR